MPEQCTTEGSKEDLNRRQQRKQRGLRSGFCDGHPVGFSATLRFSIVLDLVVLEV